MKRLITRLFALLTLAVMASPVMAQTETLVKIVADGCAQEIEDYCEDVTPGEGRVLACLYSRNDKLSGRCEYALYDAASRLERAIEGLTYVSKECQVDLNKWCEFVLAGEGRLRACLMERQSELTPRCKQATDDVGLFKE